MKHFRKTEATHLYLLHKTMQTYKLQSKSLNFNIIVMRCIAS